MEAVEARACVTGKMEEETLLRSECLAAGNEILKSKLNLTIHLPDSRPCRSSSPHQSPG